jgi:quinol monooxygenase YgiN
MSTPKLTAKTADQSVTSDHVVGPVDRRNLFGFIVRFDFKSGWEEEAKKQGLVDFIDIMIQEPTLVNFFRLQDRANPNRFVLYETWNCSKEYFLEVEMKRPYRAAYERILPDLVRTPREMQLDWRLVRSDSHPLDPSSDAGEKLGFFVHFQIKPGKAGEFRDLLDPLLDTMSKETRFINYFLLQHEQDPGRFVIYETWSGTAEDFRRVEIPRPYRQEYEKAVPDLLAKPREIEQDLKLVYAVDRGGGSAAPIADSQ